MNNRKKFLAAVIVALMIMVLGSSDALALTMSVSNPSHTLNTYMDQQYNNQGLPYPYYYRVDAIYLNANENFSVTVSFADVQGNLEWDYLNDVYRQEGYDVNFPSYNYYDIPITYFEQNNNTTDYTTEQISNVQFSHSGNTATITGTLNQDSGEIVIYFSVYDVSDNNVGVGNVGIYELVVLNQNYFNYGDTPYLIDDDLNNGISPNTTRQETYENLHVGMVEIVPEEYKTQNTIQNILDNVISIDTTKYSLDWLPTEAINRAEPNEPTQSMRDQVAGDGYQFAAKLNEIKVSEDGYYVFMVTISDDLVSADVNSLRFYQAEDSDFNPGSVASWFKAKAAAFGLINGVAGTFEVSNLFGVKIDTLPKQFLATMLFSANKSMTVYIAKILLALLGGCNIGFGVAGVAVLGFVVVKFWKRK